MSEVQGPSRPPRTIRLEVKLDTRAAAEGIARLSRKRGTNGGGS